MNRQSLNLGSVVALLMLLAACRPSPSPPLAEKGTTPDVDVHAAATALDPETQKYIWDIEHAAFELEKKFGNALITALRGGEARDIARFCRPGCTAAIPAAGRKELLDRGYLRQFRSAGETVDAEPAQLARHLLGYVAEFATVEKLTCRVLGLHADDGNTASGRWSLSLYLAGVGKNAHGELVEFVTEHDLFCSFTDDEAIEEGVIVDGWAVRSEQFRYCRQPLFSEVTKEVGLDRIDVQDNWTVAPDRVWQYHTQIAVEDFDRDGFLDLAVASVNGRWRLLKSDKGKAFKEVTRDCRIPAWADEFPKSRSRLEENYLVTWIDCDNDDYPDLLLGDRLFRNIDGQYFEDITKSSGLTFGNNPKGCVVADYDCDGLLDLYVLYQHSREFGRAAVGGWVGDDQTGRANELWKNVGGGRFVNSTEQANAGGGRRQSFAAVWFHADADHYPDLYIANDFGPNTLLRNLGNGSFEDIATAAGVSDFATSMGVAAGDLTGDGLPEIYVANMFSKMGRRIIAHVGDEDYEPGVYEQIKGSCAGNRLYSKQQQQMPYQEVSELAGVNQVGWAYAPALADFDSDGWLDIYATCGFLSYQRGKPDG